MDLNEQLGKFVGHYIYFNFLPTLNTDSIKSHNIIDVSDEDFIDHVLIYRALRIKYKFNGGDGNNDDEYEDYKKFNNHLAEKYLPHQLICYIPKIEPTDIELFKYGLMQTLCNSGACWYKLDDVDDIDISNDKVNTIIKFKLDIKKR